MPTCVTPCSASHCRSCSRSEVSVRNVRTSFFGRLLASPTSTQATTTAWWTSRPQHRSTIASIGTSCWGTPIAAPRNTKHCHSSFLLAQVRHTGILPSGAGQSVVRGLVTAKKRTDLDATGHPSLRLHHAPGGVATFVAGGARAGRQICRAACSSQQAGEDGLDLLGTRRRRGLRSRGRRRDRAQPLVSAADGRGDSDARRCEP